MQIPSELFYSKTHEWAKRETAETVVGLTAHAQEELRDVVFVELPKVGRAVKQGEPAAVVESVKAAFDVYAPVSGTVARINEAVVQSPQLINQDCYGRGWLFAIQPGDTKEFTTLLSAQDYEQQLKAGAH